MISSSCISADNAGIGYVRWSDPKEGGFSLEIPSQWYASGGTFRFSAFDARSAVHVASPDGRININIQDENVPSFTRPMHVGVISIKEGQWYTPAPGAGKMYVLRYLPGKEFAEWYANQFGAIGSTDLTILERRDRPDASETIQNLILKYGLSQTISSGEVFFSCIKNKELMKGYCFAQTIDTGSVWTIHYLVSYLAPSSQEEMAQSVLNHMLLSTQPNPEWVRAHQGNLMKYQEMVTSHNAAIADIITKSYEARQETQEKVMQEVSNTIQDRIDLIDPTTRRTFNEESGFRYYWYCPARDHVLRTNDPLWQDASCRRLEEKRW
jgi:hypothetical protein